MPSNWRQQNRGRGDNATLPDGGGRTLWVSETSSVYKYSFLRRKNETYPHPTSSGQGGL